MSKMMTITTLTVASLVAAATPAVADLPDDLRGAIQARAADAILVADSNPTRYIDGMWKTFKDGRWTPRDGSSSHSSSNSSDDDDDHDDDHDDDDDDHDDDD